MTGDRTGGDDAMTRSSDQGSKVCDPETGAVLDKAQQYADVMETVDAIIDADVLGKGDRRAKLLRYLVEMELSGRGDELKAFSIALDVLGRDASFDPSTDSIVRSEVGRLRDALRLYYAEESGHHDLRIEIPKGTYRPVITGGRPKRVRARARFYSWRILGGLAALLLALVSAGYYVFAGAGSGAMPDGRAAQPTQPFDVVRIAVVPFTTSGNNPYAEKLAFGVYAELSMALAAYPSIAIVSPVHGIAEIDPDQVDYTLGGEVYWEGDTILISARLVDTREARQVWGDSQTLTVKASEFQAAILDVASRIGYALGSGYGIAPELTKSLNVHKGEENLEAFVCFLGIYQYLSVPTDSRHMALRECLQTAVEAFPSFGDGWAALAHIYMDEARFERNPRAGADPWADAKHAIDQGLRLAPLRMTTLNVALILSIEAPKADRDAFDRFATLLINLYPSHPTTLYNVGSRRAEFAGDWEEGMALVDQAIRLVPKPPSAFFVTNAYHVAMHGSDADALSSTEPLSTRTSASQLLLRYLAAARNGLSEEMKNYRTLLSEQKLHENDHIVSHVLRRRYEPNLEAGLLGQLENAFMLETEQ